MHASDLKALDLEAHAVDVVTDDLVLHRRKWNRLLNGHRGSADGDVVAPHQVGPPWRKRAADLKPIICCRDLLVGHDRHRVERLEAFGKTDLHAPFRKDVGGLTEIAEPRVLGDMRAVVPELDHRAA